MESVQKANSFHVSIAIKIQCSRVWLLLAKVAPWLWLVTNCLK